ncbi:probable membrane-associated kinase regulator 4 [Andrographis paniculata]|uniref:probable membrane-associated kinase regulator 4 n=1 Tax=Andrographis paniculata TaxID=175694 RepID=UPI0021E7F723|nr:probable membrane-associated kinase regulator 4 [Andrographis paniculata]
MAVNIAFYDFEDDDFIDMELSSSATPKFYYSSSSNSSPPSREFEFQMCFTCSDREAISSPADDLFYQGRLLPLYLPPPLQMVKNVFHSTTTTAAATRFDVIADEEFEDDDDDDCYSMPFTEPCINVANTPLEPASISLSESCRMSCDLSLDDYYLEWPVESGSFIKNQPSKNRIWTNKLKIIKPSILGEKLRASRAYLKSLFGKSGCSEKSCRKANCNIGRKNLRKFEDKPCKIGKRNKFQLGKTSLTTFDSAMKDIDRKKMESNVQWKSFSNTIRRRSPSKYLTSSSSNSSSSSSSFSLSSGGFHDHLFRRTSSATEIEGSIEAAIAYCKKSQQLFDSTTSSMEPGICSCSASKFAGEDRQKGLALCNI